MHFYRFASAGRGIGFHVLHYPLHVEIEVHVWRWVFGAIWDGE